MREGMPLAMVVILGAVLCFFGYRHWSHLQSSKKTVHENLQTLHAWEDEDQKTLDRITRTEEPMVPFNPRARKHPRAQRPTPEPKKAVKKDIPSMIIAASEEPVIRASVPEALLPIGTLIRCVLVNTVLSSSLETPVIALVSEDVFHRGRLMIPRDTKVVSFTRKGRNRDRVHIEGGWHFIWPDGQTLSVRGTALDREFDAETNSFGILDGSAGLSGRIIRSDDWAEVKILAASMAEGFGSALQQRERTALFGSIPETTLRNGLLSGGANVAARYADMILETLRREGLMVQVVAGKEFYIFTKEPMNPGRAGTGEAIKAEG